MKVRLTVREFLDNSPLLPGEVKQKQVKRIAQYFVNLEDFGLIKHFEEEGQKVELIALELINSCNDLSIYLPIKAFCIASELLTILNYFDNEYIENSGIPGINSVPISDWDYNELDNN